MEDRALDLMIGEGPSARSVRIDLPRFTLVGATTRQGLLTTPLRDRFGIPVRLNFYTPEELLSIVARGAKVLGVELAPRMAEIARGLDQIMAEIEAGTFEFSRALEDIHLNVESRLTELIGPVARQPVRAREQETVRRDDDGVRHPRYPFGEVRDQPTEPARLGLRCRHAPSLLHRAGLLPAGAVWTGPMGPVIGIPRRARRSPDRRDIAQTICNNDWHATGDC